MYRGILIFILPLLIVCCSKREISEQSYPRLSEVTVETIADTGVRYTASIEMRGPDPIYEYGFVWSTFNSPVIGYSIKTVVGNKFTSGKYVTLVKEGLYKNQEYFVRSYALTKSFSVYGPTSSFTSLGSSKPFITNFFPKEGRWGDTVTITGKYFAFTNYDCNIHFNDVLMPLVSYNDTVVKVTVNNLLNVKKSEVSLTAGNQTATAVDSFLLLSVKSYSQKILTAH